ncbi:MFS transporter [Nocardia pseudobrasiliensis]|uniref:Sugar phosphate permease n=1 Tax=Nocardia pseudobrasiliensis TaxID=45979 RepID=A0A370HKB6_9NOCA|nr:MFS transporter [Nocardia pseudobrasiliensis]RDI59012.1 sugar phosphate permease [Nocardia pseudobrasiliensis]
MTPTATAQISSPLRVARVANSVAFGLQGFFLAVVLTELPRQRDRFGLSDTTILLAVVLISLLAAGGSLLAERLAVRWSSRVALRIGLGLIAFTGAGIALAPNTAVLFVALGGYGIALGVVDASTNMQAVFIQHGYGRFVLASFYAAWSAGSILGALFVSACEKTHVTLTPAILVAAGVVLAAGLALGPRLLGTRQAEAEPAEAAAAEIVGLRAYFALGVAMALVFAIDLAVGNWSALYLTDELLSSSATAALALAAYQGASLLTRLTGDIFVRRFGPRAVVRVAASIGTLGLVLVVAAPTPALALAGFLVAGLGLPVIAPLCFSEAGELTGGRGLDAVIARLNLFNYAGTLVGGGVVGALAAAASLRAGFAIPLIFAVLLILAARYFHPRRTG